MMLEERLLNPIRQKPSSTGGRTSVEEFYNDRSRIIYASSFRRLQQKAQVFSLEPNSNVRTRLTHSLEVADIGRTLANKIGNELLKNNHLNSADQVSQIVAIVENACLLHDIGNPPFGHFGEGAIKTWVKDNLWNCADAAGIGRNAFARILPDFAEFDGNPQGFRTITRLHCERGPFGLNLTYPTLLSVIKYPRKAGQEVESVTQKKAGYFLTEAPIVEKIYDTMGLNPNCKYPLSYIMEAADDISYCLSDVSDGIAKRILTVDSFLKSLDIEWHQLYGAEPWPLKIPEDYQGYFNAISVSWSTAIVNEIVRSYVDHFDLYLQGQEKNIIDNCPLGRAFDVIKSVSRKILYRSIEAEGNELSGFAIMTGLLNSFSELLKMKKSEFELLTNKGKSPVGAGIDLQWRVFNRLSSRMINSYKFQLDELTSSTSPQLHIFSDNDTEWWLRAHLVIDHISGMTDAFALEMYQMLSGVIRI